MDTIAQHFDMPLTSKEHRLLAETAWMGGELVAVRYYLGRLLGENLFPQSQEQVECLLRKWVAEHICPEAAALIHGVYEWGLFAEILRFTFETQTKCTHHRKPREIAAVKLYLSLPSISDEAMAGQIGTTAKQLKRMSLLNFAKDIVRRHGSPDKVSLA